MQARLYYHHSSINLISQRIEIHLKNTYLRRKNNHMNFKVHSRSNNKDKNLDDNHIKVL